MKKNLKKLFLIIAVAITAMVCLAFSASAETEGYYTYTVENGEAEITDVDTSISGGIIIPSKLGGYEVTSIGSSAFYDCTSLTSITIPDSVTSIGSSAFSNCTNLKDVILGDSLLSIAYYAFRGCTSLTSITIPDSVISIGSSAFCDCTSLESITISDNVNSMSYDVFENTAYYNDASNWDDGVLYLDNHLIDAKGNISGNYTIKNGTKTINGFDYCDSLTSVTIPDSVTMIGLEAFFGCDNLAKITIPDSITYIGSRAFNGTAYYKNENNWDNDVLYVGNHLICVGYEFSGVCKIKEGTKSFAQGAFDDCVYLQSIIIPESVVSIGSGDPFTWCESLENISVNEKNEYYSSDEHGVLFDKNKTTLIKCPRACATISSYNIPGSVTNIGGGAFYCCELESITIPSGIENIGNSAFWYCPSLANTHYSGTQEQWDKVIIGVNNSYLTNTIHTSTDENNDGVCDLCPCDHTHSYTSKITKKPNCTSTGIKTFTCTCGDIYTETMAKLGHSYSKSYTVDKKATCSSEGSKSKHCTRSGCTAKTSVTAIAKLAHTYDNNCDKTCNACKATRKITHSYKNVTTKATLSKNGKVVTKCSVCGNVKSTTTVYSPKTITLSKTSYTYNGKEQKPYVTVKDSKGNTLKNGTDYTVKYENGRTAPGRYNVKITFKGKYSGTKTLTYTIAPKVTSKVTAVQSTKAIKLTWSKVTGATGYRVFQYNSKTKKWESIKITTATSYKVQNLKAGTTYKFRIKAYKNDAGTIWGKATSTIIVATKPATPEITKLTTLKGEADFAWSNVSGESGYEVYCSTKKDSGYKKIGTYNANITNGVKINLTSGRTYYFKVRAYKTVGDTKVYSAWSAVKSVKIK